MVDAFLSEISLFGFNFAPRDWSACDGQLIPVSQNLALFSLLGTDFGGSGTSNFGLPQLQGRVAVSSGSLVPGQPAVYTRGMVGGSEYVSLSQANLPAHRHDFYASASNGDSPVNYPAPGNYQLATNASQGGAYTTAYTNAADMTQLNSAAISSKGGGQSHYNVQPYQVVLFCICTDGVYPSRN